MAYYIIGTKGTGKTTQLIDRALDLIHSGEDILLIGSDAIDRIIPHIPPDRIGHTVLFDPTQKNRVTVNPLSFTPHRAKLMFRDVAGYNGLSTARFDRLVSATIAAIKQTSRPTLLDMAYMILVPSYREVTLKLIDDPFVWAFWSLQFETWNERTRDDRTESTLAQIDTFATDRYIRNSLCYPHATTQLHSNIFLCRLPRQTLGTTARTIGLAVLAASTHDHVLIDDAALYSGETMLMHQHLTITNHSHSQLPLADAVLNISEEMMIMRLGGDDVDTFDRLLNIRDKTAIKTGELPNQRAYYCGKLITLEEPNWSRYKENAKALSAAMRELKTPTQKIEATIEKRACEVFGWRPSSLSD